MSGTNKLFLDTNIVLYLLNGDETLAEFLQDRHIYISFITELELLGYKGLTKDEKKVIQDFISQCKVININHEIKDRVISIRSNHKIKLPDAIIMATSIYLEFPLITSDNDFKNIDEDLNLVLYEL